VLKFFRQHNKQILVVVACLAMVSFLIEPALNKCQQSAQEETIGRLDGHKVTTTDIRHASAELGALNALSPVFRLMFEEPLDPLQWVLILHDARKMGLDASTREAQDVMQLCGVSNVVINEVMRSYAMTPDQVMGAVRNWSVVQQYKALAEGSTHVGTVEQIKELIQFQFKLPAPTPVSDPMLRRFIYDQRSEATITAFEVPFSKYQTEIKAPTEAQSKALFDQNKDKLPGEGEPYGFGYKYPDRVKLEYIRFPFERAKEFVQVEEVDVYAYYERNKDRYIVPATPPVPPTPPVVPPVVPPVPPVTPEKSKGDDKSKTPESPKTPETPKTGEKSKVEEKPKAEEKPKPEEKKDGCAPGDETKDAVKDAAPKADPTKDAAPKTDPAKADPTKVEPTKTEPAKTDPTKADPTKTSTAPLREDGVKPPFTGPIYRTYEEVRGEILRELQDVKARELVRKMVQDAQELMLREVRRLPQADAYYETKGFTPGSLVAIAEDLQKRYKLLPTVVRLDADWLDEAAVKKLPDFGEAILAAQGQFGITAPEYVFSVRELHEKDSKHRLVPLRLQALVPSMPITDLNSIYLFRVTAAERARVPEYAERKDDVERDARKVAAYNILQGKRAELLARAKAEKLEDIARAEGATVFSPKFSKRELDFRRGGLNVPNVPPLGQSEPFVDQVFETAEKAVKDGSLEGVPAADRVGAVAVDKRMSIVLYRVDLFKPISRMALESEAARPLASMMVARGLTPMEDPTARPLSIESLAKRTGFVREGEGKEKKNDDKKDAKKDATSAAK
jgi:hypothetical protein